MRTRRGGGAVQTRAARRAAGSSEVMLSPASRKVTQDEHQRPATPPGHVERQRRGDDTPHLFALPEDLERRVGEHLGDWPYSPALATVARTCRRAYDARPALGARVARAAARAAVALFERKAILLVAHTRWRWPPDGGPFVDLKQNFLLYITRNTSLSAVKAALDHRLRVSATATTQTRRRRPCGQTVAVGYTTFRRSRVVLEDQQSGAQLDEAALQGLVARAAPLPARDGVPGRLAVHVNLHVERYDSSDDDDDDEAAPVAAVAAPV